MTDSAKSVMLDLVYVGRFITLLLKDFKEWDAYELGIIDENGDIIKKRVDRRSSQDKKAFTKFHKVVLTIKKTLNKVSPNRVVSVVAAISLLKEHCDEEGISYPIMESNFMQYLENEHDMNYIDLLEEVPTNSTSGLANPELTRTMKKDEDSPNINISTRKRPNIKKAAKKKSGTKKNGYINR